MWVVNSEGVLTVLKGVVRWRGEEEEEGATEEEVRIKPDIINEEVAIKE